MALRLGVTRQEHMKMEKMVKEGASWPEVLEHLQDVDPAHVKKEFYDKLVAKLPKKKSTVETNDPILGNPPKQ